MKLPGPDHPITVEPHGGEVAVRFAGQVVARSRRALILREASYPPVVYIPLADVEPRFLGPSDHTSHCPYKGDARYWTLVVEDRSAANAMWAYPAPYPAMAAIAGHAAFYPSRVDAIELHPPIG